MTNKASEKYEQNKSGRGQAQRRPRSPKSGGVAPFLTVLFQTLNWFCLEFQFSTHNKKGETNLASPFHWSNPR